MYQVFALSGIIQEMYTFKESSIQVICTGMSKAVKSQSDQNEWESATCLFVSRLRSVCGSSMTG